VFVKCGESIEQGMVVKRDYIPIRKTQASIRFNVYGSINPNCEYHTDKGAKLIGFLELEIPGTSPFSPYIKIGTSEFLDFLNSFKLWSIISTRT
jgi:hypothetical protein